MELNWDAIGAIGEILGALAVFGSLAYLAIQIRNGNTASRATATRETLYRWDTATDQLWESPEVAKLMRTTLRGENPSLTNDEAMFFAIRLAHTVQIHYSVLEMAKSGLVPDELLDRVNNTVVWLLSSPGGRTWWDSTGHMMPQAAYIDSLLRDHKLTQEFVEWDDSLFDSLRKAQASDA